MSLQTYARIAMHSRNARSFGSAAAVKKRTEETFPFRPREELRTSKVNDVVVASVETNKPVSKLAVYFKAGSRYETDTTQGAVHMVRICAGLGTSGASHFGITRSIEAEGGNLSCTTGREFVAYKIEADRERIYSVDRYLQDVAVHQVFKPWEVNDNVSRARLERQLRSPEVRVMELIHKAAYRTGLGYSLYSPKWMLGNHTSEMLSSFVKTNFQQASVVAVGMPHERAVDFASRLNLKAGGGSKSKSGKASKMKFNPGADLRKETNDRLAYVALALKGAPSSDPKKAIAAALVHRALGSRPRTSAGLAPSGKLMAAIGADEVGSAAVGFSASYSDAGIVGAYLVAHPKKIDGVTRKAAEILLSAKFTNDDSKRAKGILKGDLALADETDCGLISYLGVQALISGNALPIAEQLSLVESVTAEDMNAIVSGGKLSMAAVGNLANVPYLDEL